jgi:UDP-2,3-diacylglucosamine pyrophosphatase LpxH
MTHYIPIVSDLQIPLHDKRSVAAVCDFIQNNTMVGRVGCVGDVLDQWQVSQWCRGRAGEFDGQLGKARDEAVQVMADLCITDLSRSNHDDRIEKYVAEHASGLSGLPELRLETFLHLDANRIDFHREPFAIAPGWLLLHGDEGPLSKLAGGTALGLARRTGRSVVAGHTHKMGLTHDHQTVNGRLVSSLWGFEVGNLMDMRKANYLKMGHANWQSGFGVLVVDGSDVTPVPIPIKNGRFFFDGQTWKG